MNWIKRYCSSASGSWPRYNLDSTLSRSCTVSMTSAHTPLEPGHRRHLKRVDFRPLPVPIRVAIMR